MDYFKIFIVLITLGILGGTLTLLLLTFRCKQGCQKDEDCDIDYICENNKCVSKPPPPTPIPTNNSVLIDKQPENTIQIINNTKEEFLHVFLQLNDINERWEHLEGKGVVFPPVKWEGGKEWAPLGAKIASEVIIPVNEHIILKLPDLKPPQFVMMPVQMKENSDKPLVFEDGSKRCGGTICKVSPQQAILIEAGKDVVADASAVDGINFRIKYELTTSRGIETTEIHTNPCENLDSKYTKNVDIGCVNPVHVDCPGKDTCECCPSTQKCKFTDCSVKLFNVTKESPYFNKYDYGDKDKCAEEDKKHSYPLDPPVKGFINKVSNLRDNALKHYCNSIQNNSGDFTTYCYDYNDTGSSPTLVKPYKMRITYMDL